MENSTSGTPAVASSGKMKAFFDQWRQNKRAQQQSEGDTPSKALDSGKAEGESPSRTSAGKVEEASSSGMVGRSSPVSARMVTKGAQVVEGAATVTTSALKLIRQLDTSSS